MADHMDDQPPQKRVKLRNDGFPGTTDAGKFTKNLTFEVD